MLNVINKRRTKEIPDIIFPWGIIMGLRISSVVMWRGFQLHCVTEKWNEIWKVRKKWNCQIKTYDSSFSCLTHICSIVTCDTTFNLNVSKCFYPKIVPRNIRMQIKKKISFITIISAIQNESSSHFQTHLI